MALQCVPYHIHIIYITMTDFHIKRWTSWGVGVKLCEKGCRPVTAVYNCDTTRVSVRPLYISSRNLTQFPAVLVVMKNDNFYKRRFLRFHVDASTKLKKKRQIQACLLIPQLGTLPVVFITQTCAVPVGVAGWRNKTVPGSDHRTCIQWNLTVRDISSHDCWDHNRYFRPNHDVFFT